MSSEERRANDETRGRTTTECYEKYQRERTRAFRCALSVRDGFPVVFSSGDDFVFVCFREKCRRGWAAASNSERGTGGGFERGTTREERVKRRYFSEVCRNKSERRRIPIPLKCDDCNRRVSIHRSVHFYDAANAASFKHARSKIFSLRRSFKATRTLFWLRCFRFLSP